MNEEKKKKNSPPMLKQAKISNFWSKNGPDGSRSRENEPFQVNERKKRKREDEKCKTNRSPVKKLSLAEPNTSPGSDAATVTPEDGLGKDLASDQIESVPSREKKETDFVIEDDMDFFAQDFENDPFLSPKKEKSPKKTVLGENFSNSSREAAEENWKLPLETHDLTFEAPVKCKVVKSAVVTMGRFEQVLIVRDEKSARSGVCRLREAWTFSSVSPGDWVVVLASQREGSWVVDNKAGYLVLHPDSIVSSTTLVNSMFCTRKGVLANFYRGIESGSGKPMLIGRLVHGFFENCLKATISGSDEEFSSIVSASLSSRENLHDFYFAGMGSTEAEIELRSFVPSVKNFLDVYVQKKTKPTGGNFSGSIEEILDIEELIRSPNLGLQGRIDATVKVKSKDKKDKVAPLELKTGRASFSSEHRTQLALYCLLMKEIGRKVESGLLLYLKDGTMEEVEPKRDEIRNLFLLRNRFVGYCKSIRSNDWPEPVRCISACNKCPYLRICKTHLERENLYESHPLRGLEIPDIKPTHVDYFMRWNELLWLEYGDACDIESDCTIDRLVLKPKVENFGDEFVHDFITSAAVAEEVRKKFQPGMSVSVYDGKGNRVCIGKVIRTANSCYSLAAGKRLTNFSDSYKIGISKSHFLNLYLSNLGLLLEERFQNLREIIVEKRKPTFQEKLDKKSFEEKCLKKLLRLNKEQQKAVLKSLMCNDYLLIKGPPGTGKTQTVATLVRILLAMEKTVLVAGHTHTSVDNILLRLADIDYLRLGSSKNVNEKIAGKCYEKLIEDCSTVEDVEKLFGRKLIASTCSGIEVDLISKKQFDFCIVDESSQALQVEILRPLFPSRRFILVGDDNQLPPIVKNLEAKRSGMNQSMFEWLADDSATVELKFQYRMNSRINSLANRIAYDGLLECGSEQVAKATISIRNEEILVRSDEWIREVLSDSIDKSVVFVDTSAYFAWKGMSSPEEPRSSRLEGNIVAKLVSSLVEFGLSGDAIGVTAPFADQISLLKRKLAAGNLAEVELNTIDQYQGRDKEVILFSCGKENQPDTEAAESELLNDLRRLTVAVTRAKHKLVIVGDERTVAKYAPFRRLFKFLRQSDFARLADGEKDFFWRNFED